MNDPLTGFGDAAKGLAKNPLGIIALFIVLVYGFASLVTAFGSSFTAQERIPLIYFLITFPVPVLAVFTWLVSRHPAKLYGPGDFRDDRSFLDAVASLAAATARRSDGDAATPEVNVNEIVAAVRDVSAGTRVESSSWRRRILWVDDRPSNNTLERQAFEALGLSFTLALSTQEALQILGQEKFAAIISDMGRKEGPREGYALLDAIRRRDDRTPFFIYAGSNLPEHKREAQEHGAQGSTNRPQELFQMVMSRIGKSI